MPKNTSPLEDYEQTKLVSWLEKNNILFYSVPNGGKRNFQAAMKFKRTGLKPGVPDICIPVARKSHHGLYIELKRVSGGKLSIHQVWWMARLQENGYMAVVAKGADEAIEIIKNYFDLE